MPTNEKEYYTLEELSKILNVNKETIRKRTVKGDLKSVFKFGKIYVSKEDLKEYMEHKKI